MNPRIEDYLGRMESLLDWLARLCRICHYSKDRCWSCPSSQAKEMRQEFGEFVKMIPRAPTIQEQLRMAGRPLSSREIDGEGLSQLQLRRKLSKMAADGLIRKTGHGKSTRYHDAT